MMKWGIDSRAPRRALALACLCIAAVVAPGSDVFAKVIGDGFNPSANNTVSRIGVQRDGALLVSGEFGYIGGGQNFRFARLLDGRFDRAFLPEINGTVTGTVQLDDGRLLVHGFFTQVDNTTRYGMAVLKPNGRLDPSFDIATGGTTEVTGAARQKDGKIVVVGSFSQFGTQMTWAVARLNADGTLDDTFATPFTGPEWNGGLADTVAVQADGKIVLTGYFERSDGSPPFGITRLNADGTLDSTFADVPDAVEDATFFSTRRLAIQGDGGIVIAGAFAFTFEGTSWSGLLRLHPDGTLDRDYTPLPNTLVNDLVLQSDGRAVISGPFTDIGGVPQARIARLERDGSLDPSFDAQANGAISALGLQADGKVVFGGAFSQVDGVGRSRIARLERDGSLEVDFIAGADPVYPGFLGTPRCIVFQPDGLMLAGCGFEYVGAEQRVLARLRPDGSIDPTFASPTLVPSFANRLSLMALQPDGRVVVGGAFTSINGVPRHGFARLLADGTLDNAFAPADWSAGNNGNLQALAVQSDGRILIAGYYNVGNAPMTTVMQRYLADGTLDASFTAPVVDSSISTVLVQPDGRIVIAGFFSSVNGTPRAGVARLLVDGSLDPSLDSPLDADASIVTVAHMQPDGKMLLAGYFSIGGDERSLVRLNTDGSRDTSFQPAAIDGFILTMALQMDGGIALGGGFRYIGDERRSGFARLHADGSLNIASEELAIGMVSLLSQQADGKLIALGEFQEVNGVARFGAVRLPATGAAVQTLTANSAGTVRWTLAGSAPVIDEALFEMSLDGIAWTRLGEGTRLPDGFRFAATDLPRDVPLWVRAQGIVRGGESGTANGSSSLFESVALIRLPATTSTFTVTPQASAGGQLDPAAPVDVDEGNVLALTLLPDVGHSVASVTGCGGTLDGLVYRTAPVVADCTVTATFTSVELRIFSDDFDSAAP